MGTIRKATVNEAALLTQISFRAKGYWGYSAEFLNALSSGLTVTENDIMSRLVYVFEGDCRIKGFYSLSVDNKKLDMLFVDPDFIGQGIGKLLWADVIEKAKENGLRLFSWDADPHAEQFYIKMGASKVCDMQSAIFPGRTYPLMKYEI